jgi:putative heme-binding domain-containing protein
VSDQYEAVVIETDDGKLVTGRIVNLNGDTMMVMTNMMDPNDLTGINRRKVESVTPAKNSMMPAGLIDTLKEDEILDLLAYLLSRGNPEAPMFK